MINYYPKNFLKTIGILSLNWSNKSHKEFSATLSIILNGLINNRNIYQNL